MKIAATIVGFIAFACCAGSAWLYVKTYQFYVSDAYAPNSDAMPYSFMGDTQAGGGAIFLPAALLMILCLFLAKFAWNLWRDPR